VITPKIVTGGATPTTGGGTDCTSYTCNPSTHTCEPGVVTLCRDPYICCPGVGCTSPFECSTASP
jgi:hypothetical protein